MCKTFLTRPQQPQRLHAATSTSSVVENKTGHPSVCPDIISPINQLQITTNPARSVSVWWSLSSLDTLKQAISLIVCGRSLSTWRKEHLNSAQRGSWKAKPWAMLWTMVPVCLPPEEHHKVEPFRSEQPWRSNLNGSTSSGYRSSSDNVRVWFSHTCRPKCENVNDMFDYTLALWVGGRITQMLGPLGANIIMMWWRLALGGPSGPHSVISTGSFCGSPTCLTF